MFKEIRNNLRAWNRKRLKVRFSGGNYPHELGVLGIMKNESLNIDEWISHYLTLGVEKIYLIDNGSTDDTVAKARVWVEKGVLNLIELPQKHRQRQHYWTAIKHFKIRKTCRWLLVADLDEFWFCPDGSPLPKKLAEFETADVIYANWRMFGSSGIDAHPASIRTAFVHSSPQLGRHEFKKYLCRTRVLRRFSTLGVHNIHHARSDRTVSDNHNFHLNHYVVQSREFFRVTKIVRGDVYQSKSDQVRDWTYFETYDAPCTQENRLLADLVASGRLGKGPF